MENHFQNIANAIDSLNQEIQKLKERTEKKRTNKIQQVRAAQLRIIYTILYFVGLRLNEVRLLTKNDLLLAIQTEEFNIVHTKTSECKKHILPKGAAAKLTSLLPEIEFLFQQNGFTYLGNSHRFSEKVFHETNFIRFVNNDITATCETYHFLSNFSSHSFRVGYITKLLKTLTVQQLDFIFYLSI
jgi:integrase